MFQCEIFRFVESYFASKQSIRIWTSLLRMKKNKKKKIGKKRKVPLQLVLIVESDVR